MFTYKRTLIAILTLLTMGVSFFISRQITDVFCDVYWYNMSAFWFAELLFGSTLIVLMKTDKHAMPMHFVPLGISGVYFAYVVLTAMCFTGNVSAGWLLSLHLVGLLITVAFCAFYGIAHNTAIQNRCKQKKNFISKNEFKFEIEKIKLSQAKLLCSSAEISKKFECLSDAVHFASDSIEQSGDVDASALKSLQAINNCGTADEMINLLDNAIEKLQFRQNVIKMWR